MTRICKVAERETEAHSSATALPLKRHCVCCILSTLSLLARMDAIKRKMQAMKVKLLKTSLLSSLTHTGIRQFWYTTALFWPVKSTQIRTK